MLRHPPCGTVGFQCLKIHWVCLCSSKTQCRRRKLPPESFTTSFSAQARLTMLTFNSMHLLGTLCTSPHYTELFPRIRRSSAPIMREVSVILSLDFTCSRMTEPSGSLLDMPRR